MHLQPKYSRIRNAPTNQISVKLNNAWRSYCDFNMSNLGATRHLGFERMWIFTIRQPPGTHIATTHKSSTQSGKARWVIDGLGYFPSPFSRGPIPTEQPRGAWTELRQVWVEQKQSWIHSVIYFGTKTRAAQNEYCRVKNWGHISHFLTLYKITRGIGEISKWMNPVRLSNLRNLL